MLSGQDGKDAAVRVLIGDEVNMAKMCHMLFV
jgi:hypothetical protein